ncbi:hypothetical protein BDB01DRAFT_902589 [Pilobolus umbonatus]|nr:hypothetical protein BDB01DRAFT_902589 [Pilobolus umbonatus]
MKLNDPNPYSRPCKEEEKESTDYSFIKLTPVNENISKRFSVSCFNKKGQSQTTPPKRFHLHLHTDHTPSPPNKLITRNISTPNLKDLNSIYYEKINDKLGHGPLKKRWFQLPRITLKRHSSNPLRRGYGGLKAGTVEPPEPPPQLFMDSSITSPDATADTEEWDNYFNKFTSKTTPYTGNPVFSMSQTTLNTQPVDVSNGTTLPDLTQGMQRRSSCPGLQNLVHEALSSEAQSKVEGHQEVPKTKNKHPKIGRIKLLSNMSSSRPTTATHNKKEKSNETPMSVSSETSSNKSSDKLSNKSSDRLSNKSSDKLSNKSSDRLSNHSSGRLSIKSSEKASIKENSEKENNEKASTNSSQKPDEGCIKPTGKTNKKIIIKFNEKVTVKSNESTSPTSSPTTLSPVGSSSHLNAYIFKPECIYLPHTNEVVLDFNNIKPRTYPVKRRHVIKTEMKALSIWQKLLIESLNKSFGHESLDQSSTMRIGRAKDTATRQFINQEFYNTEINFLNQLNYFKVMFSDPLKLAIERHSPLAKSSDLEVFSNLDALMEYSFKLLYGLRKSQLAFTSTQTVDVSSHKIGANINVGRVIRDLAEYLVVFLRCSIDYKTNKKGIDQVGRNKGYALYYEKLALRKETRQLTLHDYLIIPIQRITRYGLLLTDLEKHMELTYPDYNSIRIAKCLVESLAAAMNTIQA